MCGEPAQLYGRAVRTGTRVRIVGPPEPTVFAAAAREGGPYNGGCHSAREDSVQKTRVEQFVPRLPRSSS